MPTPLSITAANVARSTQGGIAQGVIAAGVTVTQGQALYQLTVGTYGLADANGTPPANTFAGIALTAGSPGQPVVFCNGDTGAFVLGATGMTVGSPIYVDKTTPGALTQTFADISGATSIIVGNPLSATTTTIITNGTGGTVA